MIFRELFEAASVIDDFVDSLSSNTQAINDFFWMDYESQKNEKEDIEKLILFKHLTISQLDYSRLENKSFLLGLLDLCERFALYGCIPHIMRIIQENGISITKRLKAAVSYIFPKPKTNEELISKVDEICTMLQEAIDSEEDDITKSQATFLGYYDTVVYNTNHFFSQSLRMEILEKIDQKCYAFLLPIQDIFNMNPDDEEAIHKTIQNRIDGLLEKAFKKTDTDSNQTAYLVESGTEYCKELQNAPADMIAIRNLALSKARTSLAGRGVKPLYSEEEMYEYIRRFGKMHYAKLICALKEPFPQSFDSKVDIIDWGCGIGIASMTFLQTYGSTVAATINLIEPSEMAIKRAALHCLKFAPGVRINTVAKHLNDLSEEDFILNRHRPTVHLFSNILDIDDYQPSQLQLLVKSLSSIKDYFICVSPYINDMKTNKIEVFKDFFTSQPGFKEYHDFENSKNGKYWLCNNRFTSSDCHHGDFSDCEPYDMDGCCKKWTRVIKVFSIEK